MRLTHNQGVLLLQIVTHAVGLPFVVVAINNEWWNWLLVSIATYGVIAVVGINVGYHRFLSHRTFNTYRPIEVGLMICGMLATVGSPLTWCIVHRIHHNHVDEDLDPYNLRRTGFLRARFGIWNVAGLSKAARVSNDIRKDQFYWNTHTHYFDLLALWCLFLYFTFGWQAVVFGYCVPAILALHTTCGFLIAPSSGGYQNHRDLPGSQRYNSWVASLITMGEGWHNNHYADPTRWNVGERWWELDPPAWVIRLIRRNNGEG